MGALPTLTAEEKARYEWQIWVPDFGEVGQRRLKDSSVLISRCGGLGSLVAYELAAAGVGRLVLAHAGNIKPSDLNRQLLMTHAALGTSRIESVRRRLLDLNPHLEIVAIGRNVGPENAQALVSEADLVVDCAPLFQERFALNQAVVFQNKPMVECAMFELHAQITTIFPGKTPCLNCLYPEDPPNWKRQFPVFGAVSGSVGCMAAMEAIKILSGFGEPLTGTLLTYDLRNFQFRRLKIQRKMDCQVCATHTSESRMQ
ncbi:MAG: HesA/MoeB/ThiF family protein [Planctomycetota bacterium]|nr:MAG: HesA/MoeB/ThiF family protein [Planctomycetota bacterium]